MFDAGWYCKEKYVAILNRSHVYMDLSTRQNDLKYRDFLFVSDTGDIKKLLFLTTESANKAEINILLARDTTRPGPKARASWVMTLWLYKGEYCTWCPPRPQNRTVHLWLMTNLVIFFWSFLLTVAMSIEKEDVEAPIKANNDNLLASFNGLLEQTVSRIKWSNEDSAESQMKEIKRLKFNEWHKFKKKANEDQFKFNQKLSETLDSAKSAAENSQLEKVKTSLEEGETLISERQKHILLTDKSDYGWATVDE